MGSFDGVGGCDGKEGGSEGVDSHVADIIDLK